MRRAVETQPHRGKCRKRVKTGGRQREFTKDGELMLSERGPRSQKEGEGEETATGKWVSVPNRGRRKDGLWEIWDSYSTLPAPEILVALKDGKGVGVLRTSTKTPFPEGTQSSAEPRAPGMGASLTI